MVLSWRWRDVKHALEATTGSRQACSSHLKHSVEYVPNMETEEAREHVAKSQKGRILWNPATMAEASWPQGDP